MGCKCSQCGTELSEDDRSPCPKCGGTARTFEVEITESVTMREMWGMKWRQAGKTGRPSAEFKSGQEFNHSRQEYVNLERRVDRVEDAYYERISTEDGEVLREVSEPLSQHTGRGDAKPRPDPS